MDFIELLDFSSFISFSYDPWSLSSAFVSFLSHRWLFNVATSFVNGPLISACWLWQCISVFPHVVAAQTPDNTKIAFLGGCEGEAMGGRKDTGSCCQDELGHQSVTTSRCWSHFLPSQCPNIPSYHVKWRAFMKWGDNCKSMKGIFMTGWWLSK